jgi:integrative and conjugative element protein (TIGR02256 family)
MGAVGHVLRWLGNGTLVPMSNRIFFCPDFRRYALFRANVLNHMYAHAQRRWWYKEAGGEFYTMEPNTPGLIITAATGPNSGDCRRRHFFNPDIKATTRDRERLFAQGLHAVGLWHTHPEAWPAPSELDHRTAEEYLEAFQGDRAYYLLVILGNCGNPPNMGVWSAGHNERSRWIELM